MSIAQFNFPTTIRFGANVVAELPDYLKKNGLSRPLVVTDPNVAQLGFFKNIVADLKAKGLAAEVFSETHKNPVKSDVYKGVAVWDASRSGCIVGVGGGE